MLTLSLVKIQHDHDKNMIEKILNLLKMKVGIENKYVYLNSSCTVQKLLENHKSFF